jgi:hypothetical protein
MSTLFLTDDELVDLTGYRQPAKQIGQLKAQRIPFHTNRRASESRPRGSGGA